jgi:hypothetical protein
MVTIEHDADYYRQRAIEQFEKAMHDQVMADRRKPMMAYLIGEL